MLVSGFKSLFFLFNLVLDCFVGFDAPVQKAIPYFAFSFSSSLDRFALLRKAKNLLQLEEAIKRIDEEEEMRRACEIEIEKEKIPKACFDYSRVQKLSSKKGLEIQKKAESLCEKRIQSTSSLSLIQKWMKISSLSAKCQFLLKERARLLMYQGKQDHWKQDHLEDFLID